MDFAAAKKVGSLIGSLTDAKAKEIDNDALKQLKSLLRGSDELVQYAQARLMDRLGTSSSQSRRLALELCGVLFSRSVAFRRALAAQFTQFVELTVGHRADKPLPPPGAAALALRESALEVIEKWHETWGMHYPQVTVAYKYLKKQYKFPDISSRAAAAAADEAARQQRHQQMLLSRYQQFTQDFPQQHQQLESLLKQMQECFELLQQPVPQKPQHEAIDSSLQQQQQEQVEGQQPHLQLRQLSDGATTQRKVAAAATSAAADGNAAATAALVAAAAAGSGGGTGESAAAAAAADDAWEEVDLQQQQQQQQLAVATAGSVDAEFDLDELVGEFQEPTVPDPDHVARHATVLEQLTDLARQARTATTTQLLDWLRLLTQLQLQDEQQQQERQRLLRAVVDLRALMQSYVQQAGSWGVSTGPAPTRHAAGGAVQQLGQLPASKTAGNSSPAAAAVTTSAAPATTAAAIAALDSLPSRVQQPLHIQSRMQQNAGASTITFGGNLLRHVGQTAQQPQQQAAAADEDVYAHLQDPTAAVRGAYTIPKEVVQRHEESRWHLRHSSDSSEAEEDQQNQASAAPAAAAAAMGAEDASGSAAAAGPGEPDAKSLDPSLRQKLLASAPKLPVSGTDWLVAHKAVAHHGMELYNHWGAVDAAVTIPQERLQQLVGYAATYYKPKKKQKMQSALVQPAGAAAAAAAAAGIQCKERSMSDPKSTEPDQSVAEQRGAANGAAGAAAVTAASRPQPVQQPTDLKDRCRPSSAPATTSGAASAAECAAAAVSMGAPGLSQQRRTRGRREEASAAHNRAVLASAAITDEDVAAAMQQQLDNEAAAAAARGGRGRGRGRKAQERKGDLVRKKLLGLK